LGAVRSSRPLVLNEAAKSGSQLKPPALPGDTYWVTIFDRTALNNSSTCWPPKCSIIRTGFAVKLLAYTGQWLLASPRKRYLGRD
jgi:hypothetical protein